MSADQKIAIVTGGSRGIGAAVARRLASRGMAVSILYLSNAGKAEEIVADIRWAGGTADSIAADVSKPAEIRQAVENIVKRHGRIDVLVNAAGILEMQPLATIDDETIARSFDVNVKSVIHMIQACLPHFPASGGRIVNLSSNLIYQPRPGAGFYAATKAAVSVLTNAFAKELGPRGITVNAVAPSLTRTDMTAATPEARLQAVTAATPLGRIGEPEDIADVVSFLASDDSRWITGRTILTDGGLTDAL